MSFADIFKKSFLEGWASTDIGFTAISVTMLITAALGVYLFVVYRVMTKKTFYSRSFAMSLVSVALITAAIIVTIQSNLVISLGMVGALSIVRFRTAITDPMDLAYLFWSISIGIICGAGLAEFAVVLCIVLTIVCLLLEKVPVAKAPVILVVNTSDIDSEASILDVVSKHSRYYTVKSRNMTPSTLDLTVEVRTSQGGELVRELVGLTGILGASLLTHDGEVTF